MQSPDRVGVSPWNSGRRVGLIPFVTLTLLISILLLVDVSALASVNPNEAFGHVVASGGFTLAAAGTFILFSKRRPSILGAMVVGAIVTVALEVAQMIAPSRGAELDDLTAGFAGVLFAAIAIELTMQLFTRLTALRVHVAVASLASLALVGVLVFNWNAGSALTAFPDGEECPETALTGDGERVTIGEASINDSCLTTESGGLGIAGGIDADGIESNAVLVTSELSELVEKVRVSGKLVLRVELLTNAFESYGDTGTIAMLITTEGSQVLHVRSSGHRLDVLGPTTARPLRAVAYAQTLQSEQRHLIEVAMSNTEMRVHVDGVEVSHSSFDAGWIEALENTGLQLLVGNNVHRSLPVQGSVEWVEIDT